MERVDEGDVPAPLEALLLPPEEGARIAASLPALVLTPEEIRLLARHLWELGGTWFAYWYLDENCSYHVLGALEAAAPRLELLTHVGKAVVLPADTVKALFRNPGLVRAVHYRPSIRTQFQARASDLTALELDTAIELAQLVAQLFTPHLQAPLCPFAPVVRAEPRRAFTLGLEVKGQRLAIADRFDLEVVAARNGADDTH